MSLWWLVSCEVGHPCTCPWVGSSRLWGDSVGDMSLLVVGMCLPEAGMSLLVACMSLLVAGMGVGTEAVGLGCCFVGLVELHWLGFLLLGRIGISMCLDQWLGNTYRYTLGSVYVVCGFLTGKRGSLCLLRYGLWLGGRGSWRI